MLAATSLSYHGHKGEWPVLPFAAFLPYGQCTVNALIEFTLSSSPSVAHIINDQNN